MPALHGVSQPKHNCQGNFLHRQKQAWHQAAKGKGYKRRKRLSTKFNVHPFGLLMELCVQIFSAVAKRTKQHPSIIPLVNRAGGISLAPLQLSLASRQQKREQEMENWSLDFLQGTDSVISPT